MKTLIVLVLSFALAVSAFAAAPSTMVTHHQRATLSLDQQWGPDAFGYRAKDSAEPGGPTYQWIDIEANGTPVSGLGDDNVVGPYPIGWNFRYYWYDVDHFWVGSNGYIEFLAGTQHAANFRQFPPPAQSFYQDVLGVWMADWLFAAAEPSLCYYWTNSDDTLIVMYKNIRAWTPGGGVGDHDFEIILSGVDSSITYMYGTSTDGDIGSNQSRGFSNITGALGLNFGFGTTDPADNYAIKIEYPDTITYAVHDLGIAGVQNNRSAGFFLVNGQTLDPWLAVRNSGNQNETSYIARYTIRNASNNALVATDDTTMGAIAPSQVDQITFPPLWTTNATGVFRAVGRVTLAGDNYTPNDSIRAEVHVVNLPGELFYDDNVSEQLWSWSGGNGGMANEFVPPVYPVEVTQVRIFVGTAGPFTAQILDDGGIGLPGNVVWSQDVPNPTGNSWATLNVTPPVVIESGPFYVAWQIEITGADFGMDTVSTLGFSRRAWEYTGVWAQFREAQTADAMIRCTIDLAGNQPPVITAFSPTSLDTAIQNVPYTFFITATDADGDPLGYSWTLNAVEVGTNPSVNITFTQLGSNHVRAEVTDGVEVDSVSWSPWVVLGTAADDPAAAMPSEFALHNAFPNPFNPVTQISYDVARAARVSLRVYNLAGELVSTLLDSRLEPGRYQTEWNASAQPSGTYFISFDASDVHQVQKILLLK